MPIALVTATLKEMDRALGFAGGGAGRVGTPEKRMIGDREFLLLATGVGLVKSGIEVGKLLAGGELSGVVNLGIAGSYDPEELPVGACCVADKEIWPEYGLETEEGVDARAIRFPQGLINGVEVWDTLELAPGDAAATMGLRLPDDALHAPSLTVGTVTGTALRAERLRRSYGAGMENMEGFALALGCAEAGIPFLEIRTISNRVGSREGWDLKGAFAALESAVRRLVEK